MPFILTTYMFNSYNWDAAEISSSVPYVPDFFISC